MGGGARRLHAVAACHTAWWWWWWWWGRMAASFALGNGKKKRKKGVGMGGVFGSGVEEEERAAEERLAVQRKTAMEMGMAHQSSSTGAQQVQLQLHHSLALSVRVSLAGFVSHRRHLTQWLCCCGDHRCLCSRGGSRLRRRIRRQGRRARGRRRGRRRRTIRISWRSRCARETLCTARSRHSVPCSLALPPCALARC